MTTGNPAALSATRLQPLLHHEYLALQENLWVEIPDFVIPANAGIHRLVESVIQKRPLVFLTRRIFNHDVSATGPGDATASHK